MSIKPGVYKGLCTEAILCKSLNKGTDSVSAVFEVFDEAGVSIGQAAGDIWWTPDTKERALKALTAMGWGKKFHASDDHKIVYLTGPFTTCDIGIKNEEYNGETRTKVDWVGAPPFGASVNKRAALKLDQAKMLQAELIAAMGGAPQF